MLLTLALLAACVNDVSVARDKTDADSDGYFAEVDCDDGRASVHPEAEEVCDGVDQDCDGVVDEDAVDPATWYADGDGDGYGGEAAYACTAPAGHIAVAGDCDDEAANVHPEADEHCDEVDEDCDGAIDEDAVDPATWYVDTDGDGYGDAPVERCEGGEGYADAGGDCDETRADVHPGAPEADCADPVDYNCDGSVGYADADSDGSPACEDCDDADAGAAPTLSETCDGTDNDCDGGVDEGLTSTWYADTDGDGFGDADTTAEACDAPPDHVADASDCDDTAADVYPGAPESCDGVDEDCDGAVDDGAGDAGTWYADGDGDGYGDPTTAVSSCEAPAGHVANAGDCDDDAPTVHPGATETCDAVDQDCDGSVDEGATDGDRWHVDADGDGFGDPAITVVACDAPAGHVADDQDCDDTAPEVSPDGTETCDGRDEDCDGLVDEDASDATVWYVDADGDGHGSTDAVVAACDAPPGYLADDGDCDDAAPDTWPGAPEQCDGVDHDCDGLVDEADAEDATAWYGDGDGDGYGDPADATIACDAPLGHVANATDCNDAAATIHPAASERCDAANVDEDCDGRSDDLDSAPAGTSVWYRDGDGDGYGSTTATAACDQPAGYVANASDCDDASATISPAASEVCDAANADEDCDGLADDLDSAPNGRATWYRDGDADGYGGTSASVACDAPAGHVRTSTDCNDAVASVNPGATEVCDAGNTDEDCDGYADDADSAPSGTIVWYRDGDADGYAGTATTTACDLPSGYLATSTDCDDSRATVHPGATEVCDPANVDEDCDGLADDADTASGRSTWYADADTDGYGGTTSVARCDAPAGHVATSTDCDDAVASVNPGATEVCDTGSTDEDCDGLADDLDASATGETTWYRDADGDSYGGTTTAVTCDRPVGYAAVGADCDDAVAAVNPSAAEVCDPANTDEDCDGRADDADSSATGQVTWYRDGDADGYGGTSTSARCDVPSGHVGTSSDCDDAVYAVNPGATEVCDPADVDEDCDGLADDEDPSVDSSSQVTLYADADGDGYGDPATLTLACDDGVGGTSDASDCDDADATAHPGGTEVEDGADNDCDGRVDNTGTWHDETIIGSRASNALSVAMDADDRFAVVHGDTTENLVLYSGSAGAWTGMRLASASRPSFSSAALDSAGDLHVLHGNENRRYVFYDLVSDGVITSSTLDTNYSSLACDHCSSLFILEDDTVRLTWTDGLGAYTRYGTGTHGSLTTGTLLSFAPARTDTDRDPVTGDLAFGFYTTSYSSYAYTFDDSFVNLDGDLLDYGTNAQRAGEGLAVAYDPDGVLHAVWHAEGERAILHATYDGATWTTETVTALSTYIEDIVDMDLAFDSAGVAHLVWSSDDTSDVYHYAIGYATWDGAWTTSTIGSSADDPTYLELRIDSTDMVHVFAILSAGEDLVHYYLW